MLNREPNEVLPPPAVAGAMPRAIGSDRCYYSPEHGVNLDYAATVYEQYHEQAHLVQHGLQCAPWRWWTIFNGIRILGYFVTIWLEYDARKRARYAMEWDDQWTPDTKKEASTKFRSYITRREVT